MKAKQKLLGNLKKDFLQIVTLYYDLIPALLVLWLWGIVPIGLYVRKYIKNFTR